MAVLSPAKDLCPPVISVHVRCVWDVMQSKMQCAADSHWLLTVLPACLTVAVLPSPPLTWVLPSSTLGAPLFCLPWVLPSFVYPGCSPSVSTLSAHLLCLP